MAERTCGRRVSCEGLWTAPFTGNGRDAVFVGLGLVCLAGCQRESRDEGGLPARPLAVAAAVVNIEESTFTRAEVCGTCHQAIHATWQQSMHSRAWSNPVFQASYQRVSQTYPDGRGRLCLGCHAPTVRATEDYGSEHELTREGVTCDFCHSVAAVDSAVSPARFEVHLGRTKYGPLKHAQSPVHQVVDSPLHRSAEFCAGCHEFQNEHGVPLLETCSEWAASPYAAEGRTCQECHMPVVAGKVAANGGRDGVNLHNISGSHDLDRVRQAVTMKILYTTRPGAGRVQARILVDNVGSGHAFPTGLPLHRAMLEIHLLSSNGQLVRQQGVAFEKVLVDEHGGPVTDELGAFFDAVSIQSDTRLRPKEKRSVSVVFDNVNLESGSVQASLWYQYSTHALRGSGDAATIEPVDMKILLSRDERILPDELR